MKAITDMPAAAQAPFRLRHWLPGVVSLAALAVFAAVVYRAFDVLKEAVGALVVALFVQVFRVFLSW